LKRPLTTAVTDNASNSSQPKAVIEGISIESKPKPKEQVLTKEQKSKSNFLKLLVEASNELRQEQDSEKIKFFNIFNDSFSIDEQDISSCPNKRYILYLSALDVNDINIDILQDNEDDVKIWKKQKDVLEDKKEDKEVTDPDKTPLQIYKPGTPRVDISCPNTAR